ncbi:response regulator transcription factor [Goodfellowiella coeruleoviolacea]|uniref:Sensory transduction protein RegX3 n=1 Tax=Goodfellowiella coeruleoviolacea TaxID=334858 RepID=A0AAE3GMP4_9PSEU|nr:response regulator transcription factor [Goodfellowiella coeruleoviolacea]MCP2170292.1 DNA-binding response regulator, OmpR family, contains REC and winged-helix (wHTH) domain [Goodfellowiella coeruleoviolacea]
MRVLLVEDDDRVAEALVPALTRRGFTVERLATGRPALDRLAGVDVVLLDLGLPDVDGVTLCRSIRAASDVAIIVVTARGEVDDRILGLHAGADDYLVKPYDVGELVARVHAVWRRRGHQVGPGIPSGLPGAAGPGGHLVRVGDTEIDLARHEVRVAGQPVTLARKEFQVLAMVVAAGGAVCTRERILAEVWGRTWSGANRTLDVHVANLRTKLGRPQLIETVRGVGYRLAAPTGPVSGADGGSAG